MKRHLLIIIILGIAVHFAFFGYPNETVFDEVHFGKFVSGYYTGEYYFDIHPPLGKLTIAGFAKLFDFQPQYSFANIGEEFPDNKYLALRFLPALAGTLLSLVIYLLILELGMSRMAAFTGGLLIVFENALLTQSRFILLDPFLLLFGFTSLLFYFKYRRQNHPQHSHILKNMRMLWDWNLFWMAIFSGLAISIKWTGLTFLALPFIIEIFRILKERSFKKVPALFACFAIVPFVIYFSIFALHFALLPKPGPGDIFMSFKFREAGVVSKFMELNREMYNSNQRLTATHPYGSSWYTWPIMARPIFYWVKNNPSTSSGQAARIYFFGNPVVWWTSTAAVLYLVLATAYSTFRKKGLFASRYSLVAILLGGYFLNLLPFIGVKRVMFLYHYLAALIFAILILCYLVDQNKNSRKIFTGIMIAAIAVFLFFAPLSYGLPISTKAYSARVWFASWR